MAVKQILYFDRPGHQNTSQVINAVKKRVKELGIKYVVTASNSGKTGLKLWHALQGTGCTLISVTEYAGSYGKDTVPLSEKTKKDMERKGIKTLVCSHAFSGVGRAVSKKFGGTSHVEIIAQTLKQFGGEGIKVAVEVALMAADAGLIPTGKEIIGVGGTSSGADSAIVLKAAHMNNYFDLEIREIIAKPRQRNKL